jgi:hypothetical protein
MNHPEWLFHESKTLVPYHTSAIQKIVNVYGNGLSRRMVLQTKFDQDFLLLHTHKRIESYILLLTAILAAADRRNGRRITNAAFMHGRDG